MSSALHVRNLGGILAAEPVWGWRQETELLCAEGRIVAIGRAVEDRLLSLRDAGGRVTVLDAAGLIAIPGLIDGHVHPVVGSVSVVPQGYGWTDAYLNAGVTAMVSAGELTVPGFSASALTPEAATQLAATSAWLYGNIRTPPRVYAGTLLAVPGMRRHHFHAVAAAGGRCVKYIYYPFAQRGWEDEVATYRVWAHEYGLVTKMHAGGTSYQGHSVEVTAETVQAVAPAVLAHVNGGPIPLADDQLSVVIEHTDCNVEVILGGNLRLLRDVVTGLRERGQLSRLTVGTDTPGGNGTMPRGPLQVVAAIAGLGQVDAASAIRCATEHVARAHGIDGGAIAESSPADFLLVGPVRGSASSSVVDALESGEIVGVGAVVCRGDVAALPGRFTPPPATLPELVGTREDT